MLTFVKRPRRDQTIAADRKLWTSKCRQYRVAFSRCRYGPRDERGLSDVWRTQYFDRVPLLGRPDVCRSLPRAWRGFGSGKPAAGKRGQAPFVRSTLRAVPANGACSFFPANRKLKSEIRRLSTKDGDGGEFALSNTAPTPKPWRGDEPENTRQTVLLSGLDCLRGNKTCLPPMATAETLFCRARAGVGVRRPPGDRTPTQQAGGPRTAA